MVKVDNRPVNYNSCDEFQNLTAPHKALVVVVSIFISVLTLGLAAPFVIPSLIGRLRKLELGEDTDQADAADKADEVAQDVLAGKDVNDKENLDNDGDIPPELEVELALEAEREKVIADFYHEHKFIDQVIEELKGDKKAYKDVELNKVFEKYVEHKKKENKDFSVSEENQFIIQDEIDDILKDKDDPIKFPYALENGREMVVTDNKTVGDGSCGFHVIVGILVDGYYVCDATEERKKFCKHLKEAFDKKKLPQKIEQALDNYFLDPDDKANEEFTKLLTKKEGLRNPKTINVLRDKYKKDYDKLSIKDQEKRKEEFKKDKFVFGKYLQYIGKNSTYLLQDELEAVAEFYDVRIRLFQKGWGADDNLAEGVLNEKGKREVLVYFKARNRHYERVQVRPIEEKKAQA